MSLLSESDANFPRSHRAPLTHVSGDSDSSPDCTVRDWVRRGDESPVEKVPLGSIRDSHSPRKAKLNEYHAGVLAQSPLPLPPIVIHRSSMRVIDGVHRLRATGLRGEDTIAATFFDGSDAEAFALAVHLNVTHGLPLTLSERKAAAQKIVEQHPHWSDRSIGLIAGCRTKQSENCGVCNWGSCPVGPPARARRQGPAGESVGRAAARGRISVQQSPRVAARDRPVGGRFGDNRARCAPAYRRW